MAEYGDEERVAGAAAQQDRLFVGELEDRVPEGDQVKRRRLVLGAVAGLIDEVLVFVVAEKGAGRVEVDVEQDEVVLRGDDPGVVAEPVLRQARAVEGEAGDARWGNRPEGHQDGVPVHRDCSGGAAVHARALT